MMKLESVIDYWAQISVLLSVVFAGIGYIVKIFLNSRAKKSEIKFDLFYNRKIVALEEFITSFKNFERFFFDVPFYSVARKEIRAKELDLLVKPYRNTFYLKNNLLKIYCTGQSLAIIDELNSNVDKCSSCLSDLLFSEIVNEKVYDYVIDIGKIEKNSHKLVEKLLQSFRKEYN